MGSLRSNHVLPTLTFIHACNNEALSLHLHQHLTALLNLEERQTDKNTRMVYSGGEKDRNIEQ
jgi:hypothetical protein